MRRAIAVACICGSRCHSMKLALRNLTKVPKRFVIDLLLWFSFLFVYCHTVTYALDDVRGQRGMVVLVCVSFVCVVFT